MGVLLTPNALGLIDSDAGGSGNIGGEPSPSAVLFWLDGAEVIISRPAGFVGAVSFWYSAPFTMASVAISSDLYGEGVEYAAADLPLTPESGAPDPTGVFSPFVFVEVPFNGVAKSIRVTGGANQIAIDDIQLGANLNGRSDSTCSSESSSGSSSTHTSTSSRSHRSTGGRGSRPEGKIRPNSYQSWPHQSTIYTK